MTHHQLVSVVKAVFEDLDRSFIAILHCPVPGPVMYKWRYLNLSIFVTCWFVWMVASNCSQNPCLLQRSPKKGAISSLGRATRGTGTAGRAVDLLTIGPCVN